MRARSRQQQIELRRNAQWTCHVERRARVRDVSYDAIDGAAIELDDAGLQHTLARCCALVVQNLERHFGLRLLGQPLLGEPFGVLGRSRNVLLRQCRSDPGPCKLEPHLTVPEINGDSFVAGRGILTIDIACRVCGCFRILAIESPRQTTS